MKLALGQLDVKLGQFEENYAQAEEFIRQAAEAGCEAILFSEMCFSGFSMDIEAICERDYRSVKRMTQLAKEYDITIGFGWGKLPKTAEVGDRGENRYTVISPSGDIIADYKKIHPFTYAMEERVFESGEELSFFEMGGMKCANIICYDLRFIEMFEAFPLDVHLVIVPANWPDARRMHWDTLTRARAIDYQVYIAAINSYGEQGGTIHRGGTKLIAPNGEIIEEQPNEPGVLIVEFEDETDEIRRKFPVRKDRRPDLFR